jgi:hypothetical protein
MNKFLLKGFSAGFALLVISYSALYLLVMLFPALAVEYYDPMFSFSDEKTVMFFLHPFILSFSLAWFWRRFKSLFHGPFWWRGMEMGMVYGLIATLPGLWMVYSAMSVSLTMVLSWLAYGFFQAMVTGVIFAKISP